MYWDVVPTRPFSLFQPGSDQRFESQISSSAGYTGLVAYGLGRTFSKYYDPILTLPYATSHSIRHHSLHQPYPHPPSSSPPQHMLGPEPFHYPSHSQSVDLDQAIEDILGQGRQEIVFHKSSWGSGYNSGVRQRGNKKPTAVKQGGDERCMVISFGAASNFQGCTSS